MSSCSSSSHHSKTHPSQAIQRRIRDLLPHTTPAEIEALAAVLPMAQVTVSMPPATGLIMAKSRDCFNTSFYLGEILVTRAEVRYRGHRAQATLMGKLPEQTLIAAVLEVLALDDQTVALAEAEKVCEPVKHRLEGQRRIEERLLAATRVSFESMAEED